MKHFLTDMSNRVEHQKLNQVTAELPPGWVFGVQLGLRQTQALFKTKTIRRGRVPLATLLLSSKLLISYCVCRRPSWKPKTLPNENSAVVWLSFWFSTWFTRKTLDHSRGTYLYPGFRYHLYTLRFRTVFSNSIRTRYVSVPPFEKLPVLRTVSVSII